MTSLTTGKQLSNPGFAMFGVVVVLGCLIDAFDASEQHLT
jgi:hypothetical protein